VLNNQDPDPGGTGGSYFRDLKKLFLGYNTLDPDWKKVCVDLHNVEWLHAVPAEGGSVRGSQSRAGVGGRRGAAPDPAAPPPAHTAPCHCSRSPVGHSLIKLDK
jgi:hypothetical protein